MSAGPLLLALALDAVLGEPKQLWSRVAHPAVVMGRVIDWADARFNTGPARRLNGTLTLIALIAGAALLGSILSLGGPLIETAIAAILLAQKSLAEHVSAVATALRSSLKEGRAAVAMIVGRDTAEMDGPAVARGAIESAAENLSDGVIAPAFWFLIGGLPGLLVYKITNTADSMIGYKTERHKDFGWAAARFDDFLNLIPARLTALLIVIAYRLWPARRDIMTEAARHRSPNAGWPEAAMARAIGTALSGPRSYAGKLTDFPFVNPQGRKRIGPHDIDAATRALWVTWGAFTALVFVLWILGF